MGIRHAIATRRAVRRRYEQDVGAVLRRLVEPGAVCVDAGAYHGTFTLLMARRVGPHGHVYAFEPHPDSAAQARRAAKRRGLATRVTVVEAALLDTSGEVELFPGREGSASEWTADPAFAAREDILPVERHPIRVRAFALDDYLSEDQRVDVVKIDVEGAEARTLAGMRRILAVSAPAVVLEFHREAGWPAISLLDESAYRFFTLEGEPLGGFAGPDEAPYHLLPLRY